MYKPRLSNVFLSIILMMLATQNLQAIDIKQDQVNQCTVGMVKANIADKANASDFCNCTVNIRSSMTIGQMWEIESYAQSGKDPSSLPYAQKMQNAMTQCSKNLTLKIPTK